MHTLEQINPIHILTARVNGLEKAMREMQEAKAELHRKMAVIMDMKPVEAIKELKIPDAVKTEGNTPEAVDKRYRVWQVLYENGYTISTIARAWNTDRGSIRNAKNNGWRSRYMNKENYK